MCQTLPPRPMTSVYKNGGEEAVWFTRLSVAGFDTVDFCIDIYYWFDKSTKHKQALQEFCVFCNTEFAGMVNHVSTR